MDDHLAASFTIESIAYNMKSIRGCTTIGFIPANAAPTAAPADNTAAAASSKNTQATSAASKSDEVVDEARAGGESPIMSEAKQGDVTSGETASSTASTGDPAQMWPQVTDAMKGLPKAIFKPAIVESFDGKKLTIKLPANTPIKRAQDQSEAVINAVKQVSGVTCIV